MYQKIFFPKFLENTLFDWHCPALTLFCNGSCRIYWRQTHITDTIYIQTFINHTSQISSSKNPQARLWKNNLQPKNVCTRAPINLRSCFQVKNSSGNYLTVNWKVRNYNNNNNTNELYLIKVCNEQAKKTL